MSDSNPIKGPAAYFPFIERTYGKPIAHWLDVIDAVKDRKHMDMVDHLKAGHGLGHGHANALVAYFRAGPAKAISARKNRKPTHEPHGILV